MGGIVVKKVFASVLALAMCCAMSVSVFAAEIDQDSDHQTGNTEVSLNVDPVYTVTIPATVELDKIAGEAVTYEKDLTVVAEAGMRLQKDQTVQVKLASDFMMESDEDASLAYTVTVNDEKIENGGIVATFETSDATQSSILHFAAADPEYAGNYSDTVTFTISVSVKTGVTPDPDWRHKVSIGF